MTVELAVLTRLQSSITLAALVGTRLYSVKLPQNPVLPAVRVQLISEPEFGHLRGGSKLRTARVEVDAVVEETSGVDPKAQVDNISDAINDWLMNQPPMRFGSPEEIEIKITNRLNKVGFYQPDEFRQIRVALDYEVMSRQLT